jgi:hypothetical protein
MNLSNWSGWHWVIVTLTAALAAEHAPAVMAALGSVDTAAITVTTGLLAVVGILAPSAAGKR